MSHKYTVITFCFKQSHDILNEEATDGESWNVMRIGIYLLMLLVPFFWGGAFVAAEHIITEIHPLIAAAFRFLMAGLLLLIIIFKSGQFSQQSFKKRWILITLMALTGIFGYNIFFFYGLQMTSAINGSLIIATTPSFMTLGAVLFFKERWNKYIGLGIILSFIGVVVVLTEGQLHTLFQLNFNNGDILFIFALICWISHGLLGKVVMQDVSPMITTTFSTLIGALLLCIVTLPKLEKWHQLLTMSKQSWLEMSFMIVCSSVLAFLIWNYGIQQIGASQASIYMNLVPINTALLAILVYDSPMLLSQIIGMIVVIIGVYFVTVHQYLMVKR